MLLLSVLSGDATPAGEGWTGYLETAATTSDGQVITVDGGQSLRRGPSLAGAIEPLFGEDGLRGVVADPA